MELFPVEEQKPLPWRQNRRHWCAGRRVCDERVYRLALVRREGRDVNELLYFGIVTRLSDHRPAIGVAHENDGFALRVDDEIGRGDVTCQRKRRILDDRDVVAVFLQVLVDTLPAGAVYETAVNKNDSGHHVRVAHEKSLSVMVALWYCRLRLGGVLPTPRREPRSTTCIGGVPSVAAAAKAKRPWSVNPTTLRP